MVNIIDAVGNRLDTPRFDGALKEASQLLTALVEPGAYVGDVNSLGYESALVQVHDFYRQRVGGIPALSFLIATRIAGHTDLDVRAEDSSLILLRVLDQADLPNSAEALRVRVENAQQVSGEVDRNWHHKDVMDASTAHLLSYAGVRCRVIGTFFVAEIRNESEARYALSFRSDISNYYPNRGLKVFKPRGAVLQQIANYRDPLVNTESSQPMVDIGTIRYASTHRPFQNIGSASLFPGFRVKTFAGGLTLSVVRRRNKTTAFGHRTERVPQNGADCGTHNDIAAVFAGHRQAWMRYDRRHSLMGSLPRRQCI